MTEASFVVPASLAGERLDRCLALLTGRTRSEIADLIACGAVRVDGSEARVRHRRMAEGEMVAAELGARQVQAGVVANSQVPFRVVYEDAELIVVDKPAGVVVHPGAGHRDDTLVSGLLATFPDLGALAEDDPVRPGIVHRLDKDTSGLLVVARTNEARAVLQGQLADREMARIYRSLARGALEDERGVIDAPIGRSVRDPTKMAVRESGRGARTSYEVLSRYSSPSPLTYLELRLDTGRTHQIRVHLQAIGHPVAGDRRYGGSVAGIGLERPFLHAARLVLRHPATGELLEFSAPLPQDLEAVLARLS